MTRERPRGIVDLDGIPEGFWRLREEAVHLYQGKLWRLEPRVCVLCVDQDRAVAGSRTLRFEEPDGRESYVCLTHGEVVPVDCLIGREYVCTIEGVTRKGGHSDDGTILFPVAMSSEERVRTITLVLDEMEKDEATRYCMDDSGE